MRQPEDKPKAMVVAGLMSGTSADGVDVALVRIRPAKEAARPKQTLLAHVSVPFSPKLRHAVLAAMDAESISVAELGRLHWRLGQIYADAVQRAQDQAGVRTQLVGMHGQTIYHQPAATSYLGAPVRCTWQIGESAEIAHKTGLPVVSDFRPADMVAGGQGAPLVPAFDQAFFSHPKRNRVLQNIGGIANMTVLPAGSSDVLAFDSGPGNMLIDACIQALFGRRYDRNGAVAARGNVLQPVLEGALKMAYFSAPCPKSCGREEFGRAFADRFLLDCRKAGGADADVIATATALTARSILHAYRTFVWPFLGQHAPLADTTDYIVSGGGANNAALMRQVRAGLEPLGISVRTSEEFGLPSSAKEAMAFALLAWLRWNHLPGNVPSATGASRSMLLGKVTLP